MCRRLTRKAGVGLRAFYSLLPSIRLAALVSATLYLIVYPPEVRFDLGEGAARPPFVSHTVNGRWNDGGDGGDRAAGAASSPMGPGPSSTLNPSLSYKPPEEDEPLYNYDLDPFGDHWRTMKVPGVGDIHLYSAFLDDRRKDTVNIKVNVAVPSNYRNKHANTMRCVLEHAATGKRIVTKTRAVQFKEHFALPYGSYFIQCEFDFRKLGTNWSKVALIKAYQGCEEDYAEGRKKEMPQPALDVNFFPVQGEEQRKQKEHAMAACIKPFHYDWNRALWLVEFLEMHKLLGVTHFVFYNHTLGPAVERVLNRYRRTGEVSVLRWNLPLRSQKQIRTEGMFTALNECNLRLVHRFEFVLMVDVDEYILPYNATTFQGMFDRMRIKRNTGSFVFRNAFHYLYWENDTATTERYAKGLFPAYGVTNKTVRPYMLTQTKTRRLVNLHKFGARSKYIARPEAAELIGNHQVWSLLPGFSPSNVDPRHAVSHHYRICEFGGFNCLKGASTVDRVAHNWADELFPNVKRACDRAFGEKNGCPLAPPLGSPW